MSTSPARRGPAPRKTADEIAAAGVALADREGLAAVTMRQLSTELGTGGGALYRYVASRDQLLDLMVDAASAELPTTPPGRGEPIADLVAIGHDLYGLYVRHPWLTDVRQAAAVPGPHAIDHFERCLAALAPLEVPARARMEAVALVTGIVTLFARQHTGATATTLPTDPDVLADRWPHLADVLNADPADASTARERDLFDAVLAGTLRAALTS